MNILILKMGGSGTRFGSDIPKQYHEFNGQPLFVHILQEYEKIGIINKYIIVSNKDWIEFSLKYASSILGEKLVDVIPGGETGAKSIKNGVMCARKIASENDIILLHDATNPVVVYGKIPEVICAGKKYGFATLGMEQVHAIYSKDNDEFATGIIDKKTIISGYSPEAFLFKYLYDCYSTATEEELETATSAISLAKWHNAKVKIIVASFLNLKITYHDDLEIFKKVFGKE